MTDQHDLDFERALRRSLRDAAPAADPGLAHRLLSRTAAEPQRGRWSLFSGFAPAMAAVAVVALAVIVGLGLAQLPRVGDGPSPSAAPPVTSPPSATPSPSPTSGATPSDPVTPSPTPTPEGQACTNEDLGFEVVFPADWHTNEPIDQEFANDTPPCTHFGPEPMEIAGNAGLPNTVAISLSRASEVSPDPTSARLVTEDQVTVDGLPATVTEWEFTEDDVFVRRGDRLYVYEVELPDGSFLVAATNPRAIGDHEERRQVLDAMMDSLAMLP